MNRPGTGASSAGLLPESPLQGRRRWLAGLPALALAPGSAFASAPFEGRREAHWRRVLAGADSVWEGSGGDALHVFFDAACPACAALHAGTRSALWQALARIQWLPVAVLGEASLVRGAQVLAASDKRSALARAFRGELSPVPGWRELCAAVEANSGLLRQLAGGQVATPGLLIDSYSGGMRFEIGIPAAFRG
jgi:hypothetical protein